MVRGAITNNDLFEGRYFVMCYLIISNAHLIHGLEHCTCFHLSRFVSLSRFFSVDIALASVYTDQTRQLPALHHNLGAVDISLSGGR